MKYNSPAFWREPLSSSVKSSSLKVTHFLSKLNIFWKICSGTFSCIIFVRCMLHVFIYLTRIYLYLHWKLDQSAFFPSDVSFPETMTSVGWKFKGGFKCDVKGWVGWRRRPPLKVDERNHTKTTQICLFRSQKNVRLLDFVAMFSKCTLAFTPITLNLWPRP